MAVSSQLEFVQSFSGFLPGEFKGAFLFTVIDCGKQSITVALPNAKWADLQVTLNGLLINLTGEYPPQINRAIKFARKLFPHWQG